MVGPFEYRSGIQITVHKDDIIDIYGGKHHLKTGPVFKCHLKFGHLNVRISDAIRKPDHLQTGQLLTIRKPD